MANHVLGHIDWQKSTTVVYVKIKADKVGSDSGAARPCLDRLAVVVGLCDNNLFGEVRIDKETFFYGTRHS